VILIKNVTETVPLRAALKGHGHHVVGGTNTTLVKRAGISVRASAQHGVDRLGATHRGIFAFCALRSGMIEIQCGGNRLARRDETGGSNDIIRRRIVERTNLIIRTPLAPILVLLRGLSDVLTGDLSR